MRPHKKLDVWKEAMELVEGVYKLTSVFPKEEVYMLAAQMKRAAVSVVSNIGEGCARRTIKERIQFLMMSRGSLSELDAQLEIALRLKFINEKKFNETADKVDKVSRMLQGLIDSHG